MKRASIFIAVLLIANCLLVAGAEEITDHSRVLPIIQDSFFDSLDASDDMTLYIAAEIGMGAIERDFLGGNATAESVVRNKVSTTKDMVESVRKELKRILIGPWVNNGRTIFDRTAMRGGYILDLDTGKWEERPAGFASTGFKIYHFSEEDDSLRIAYLVTFDSTRRTLWRATLE